MATDRFRQYIFRLASLLPVMLVIAGCASPTGAVKNASPLTIVRSLSVDHILVETSDISAGMEMEKNTLRDAVISGLNETGLFNLVTGSRAEASPGNGIKIQATVTEVKKVSDQARSWTGFWAGQARIKVRVTISDLNSGSQIETFEAEGESGQSAWAGTTDEAVHWAAAEIVAEVIKINAQTGQ